MPNEVGLFAGIGTLLAALVAAVVAWRRAPSDSAKVLIAASTDVVVIQKGLIEDLEDRLEASESREAEMSRQIEGLDLRSASHVAELEDRVRSLEGENTGLRDRVQHLEDENALLRNELAALRTETT